MPLSNLLRSVAGICPLCRQKAGVFRRTHPECLRTYTAGRHQMLQLASQAASSHRFDENALHRSLSEIASRSYGDADTVTWALEEGWKLGVRQATADGTISLEQEVRLRDFRNRLALSNSTADPTSATQLYQASRKRLLPQAQDTALLAGDGNRKLDDLSKAFKDAGLDREARYQLVREAWGAAVESILNSRLLTRDEEDSLKRYMGYFGLTPGQLNGRVPYRTLVYSGILREITEGRLPPKQEVNFIIPFNLMKSETLVWAMQNVEYHKTVTRRERQGTSDGISTSMGRGIYYRSGTFRSRTIEWDEPVHADTGLLGFTTKHIYFAGKKEMFRVRYDKIVAFEYYGDGFGIMREALTAKPQAFRTGERDGWFAHDLAVNLAKM